MSQADPGQIAFRRAERTDLPRLVELLCLGAGGVVDAVYDGIPGTEPAAKLIERRFAVPGSVNHYGNSAVAVHRGAVVGQLISYPMDSALSEAPDPIIPSSHLIYWRPMKALRVPGSYYISSLAVLPGYQNRGIGSALITIARSRAREEGLRDVSLHVFEQNRRAVSLYRRSGFEVVGREPAVSHRLIRFTGDLLAMAAPA